jgi:hypothetical protein
VKLTPRKGYELKRIALAAAGVAVVGLAACSQTAGPAAAPASQGTVTPPVSCSQQYRAWEHRLGKGLMAALHAVTSAETSGGIHVVTIALKKAEPAVARAARHPMPACADPRGYWNVLLMHVNAAAAGKGSEPSLRAAMKDVPMIHHMLMAEIKRTAK